MDADVELLQLELRATREEAASAKGHTKQFQELATNAERTIKDMEVSHEMCEVINGGVRNFCAIFDIPNIFSKKSHHMCLYRQLAVSRVVLPHSL